MRAMGVSGAACTIPVPWDATNYSDTQILIMQSSMYMQECKEVK